MEKHYDQLITFLKSITHTGAIVLVLLLPSVFCAGIFVLNPTMFIALSWVKILFVSMGLAFAAVGVLVPHILVCFFVFKFLGAETLMAACMLFALFLSATTLGLTVLLKVLFETPCCGFGCKTWALIFALFVFLTNIFLLLRWKVIAHLMAEPVHESFSQQTDK